MYRSQSTINAICQTLTAITFDVKVCTLLSKNALIETGKNATGQDTDSNYEGRTESHEQQFFVK